MRRRLRKNLFDFLSIAFILVLLIFSIIKWFIYPIFVDIYYHMGVMEGFNITGGVVVNSFWEFAPFGRPHLYPPLLHIFMLFLLKLGFKEIFIARFTSFIMFPLTLFTLWYVLREIFDSETALYSVIFLGSLSYFFWQSSVTSAASLTQIIGLFVWYSIEKNKKFASALLMTLMLYSHLTLSHLYVFSFFLYSFFKKGKERKFILLSILVSYILFSPWLFNIISNFEYLNLRSPSMDKLHYIHIILWIFALFGIFFSVKKKRRYIFPLLLLISLAPIIFLYPDRFWNAHSFIPLSILAGVGLSSLRRWSEKNLNPTYHKNSICFIRIAIFILILSISLSDSILVFGKNKLRIEKAPSTIIALITAERGNVSVRGPRGTLLTEENIRLVNFLKENTDEHDTIFIQNGILSNLITGLGKRFGSSGMFHEVKPYRYPKPEDCSIVLIPVSHKTPTNFLNNNHFREIGEVSGYKIFKNTDAVPQIEVEKPVISTSFAFVLVFLFLSISFYDTVRKNRKDFKILMTFLVIFFLLILLLSFYDPSIKPVSEAVERPSRFKGINRVEIQRKLDALKIIIERGKFTAEERNKLSKFLTFIEKDLMKGKMAEANKKLEYILNKIFPKHP